MAEELIRSVLWFHPAVWFVLSRVQLAREQVVDQEVVHATRDRAGYLDALVSVAAQRLAGGRRAGPIILEETPARRASAGAIEGDSPCPHPVLPPMFRSPRP